MSYRAFRAFKRLALGLAVAGSLATGAYADDLSNQPWRIYSRVFTPKLWDISRANTIPTGGVSFAFSQFLTADSGAFAVYLMNNYNRDMTKKSSIQASFDWTAGTFHTRSTTYPGAYVRIWLQDVASGPYDSNDYWWCHSSTNPVFDVSLDTGSTGSISCDLTDRSQWMNQAGRYANDTTTNWTDWTGTVVAMSPYDGYTHALKNVKQLGLSFGSSGSYASGVAADVTPSRFNLRSFTIN